MIYYVDIDNTILQTVDMNYENSIPIVDRIEKINRLYDAGHEIIYWTARGTLSGIDYTELTKNQFKKFNVKYTKLLFNKPVYDLFIDDKNINSDVYFNRKSVTILCRGESLAYINMLPKTDVCILVNSFYKELLIEDINTYVKLCPEIIHMLSFGSQSSNMIDIYKKYNINKIVAPYIAECMPQVPSYLHSILKNQKENIQLYCMSDVNKSDMVWNNRYKFTSPTTGMDAILYSVNDLHATEINIIGMDFYDDSGYLTNSHGITAVDKDLCIKNGEDPNYMKSFLYNFIKSKNNIKFNIYTKSNINFDLHNVCYIKVK